MPTKYDEMVEGLADDLQRLKPYMTRESAVALARQEISNAAFRGFYAAATGGAK